MGIYFSFLVLVLRWIVLLVGWVVLVLCLFGSNSVMRCGCFFCLVYVIRVRLLGY